MLFHTFAGESLFGEGIQTSLRSSRLRVSNTFTLNCGCAPAHCFYMCADFLQLPAFLDEVCGFGDCARGVEDMHGFVVIVAGELRVRPGREESAAMQGATQRYGLDARFPMLQELERELRTLLCEVGAGGGAGQQQIEELQSGMCAVLGCSARLRDDGVDVRQRRAGDFGECGQ